MQITCVLIHEKITQLNTYMFVNTQDINLCLLIHVERKQLKQSLQILHDCSYDLSKVHSLQSSVCE